MMLSSLQRAVFFCERCERGLCQERDKFLKQQLLCEA